MFEFQMVEKEVLDEVPEPQKIAEVLETPAWTLFSEYSEKIRDAQEGDELLKFLLKNKINDAIEEVLK